jgi:DNA repair protein RecO (recombination protein O)
MAQTIQTEGVILQAFNYQDYDRILSVFTYDHGLIKLISKWANSPKQRTKVITAPLTHAEFIYTQTQSELHTCREISPIKQHLELRQSLPVLEAACQMAQALNSTQPLNTPAPDLYRLFNSYLDKLPSMKDPHALTASFKLKLLRHDGVLLLNEVCSHCSAPLDEGSLFSGEVFCLRHVPNGGVPFNKEEFLLLSMLAHCRSFGQVQDLVPSKSFLEKISKVASMT